MRQLCECGGYIMADRRDPTPGVRAHQEAEPHRSWADARFEARRRPTAGALTVGRLEYLGYRVNRDVYTFGVEASDPQHMTRPGSRLPRSSRAESSSARQAR